MKARHAREIREAEQRLAIMEQMPSVPRSPSIANLSDTASAYSGNGTISFSGPSYDPEKTYSPLAVAQALEADGWTLLPATRAKYGQWRRVMMWGTVEEIPETVNRAELVDCEPALPVWVAPNQFTPCEVACWMKSPAGTIHKVTIDTPGFASISAQRVEERGRWYYARGTGKVHLPDRKRELFDKSGEQFASVRDCFCIVDTEQGISGQITWQLDRDGQSEFPLTLSQVMEAMGIN